jgi:hypothetical protein
LFNFASEAILTLRNAIPYAITDALIRVDIFQSKKGLVVNEFESLEATFNRVKDEEATVATNWNLYLGQYNPTMCWMLIWKYILSQRAADKREARLSSQ